MNLGDVSLPFLVALVAFVTALASLAGRARDKATIVAYKENADAQDRTIMNQSGEISSLKAENKALDTRCTVLERTANSAELINAQTEVIHEQTLILGQVKDAIDRHAADAETWWATLHEDLTNRGRRSDEQPDR